MKFKFLLATIAFTAQVNAPIYYNEQPCIDVVCTEDSVYKQNNILGIEIIEHQDTQETNLVDVQFTLNHLVGYTIYDNASTDFIDGIRINDEFLDNSLIYHNLDITKTNTVHVKTVYTDDYSGLILMARDGGWTEIVKNPMILVQILTAILTDLGVLGLIVALLKQKKKYDNIGTTVENTINKKSDTHSEQNIAVLETYVKHIQSHTDKQIDKIVTTLVLIAEGTEKGRLAALELLKDKDAIELTNEIIDIKDKIIRKGEQAKQIVEDAKQTIEAIAHPEEPKETGTSI